MTIADYDEALRVDPSNATAFTNRGLAYSRKGELDKAFQDFGQAIRLDPKNAVMFSNRGVAFADKGEYDHAIEDFDQALQLNPNEFDVYLARGHAYQQKGDRDHAAVDYNKALSLAPNDDTKKKIYAALNELDTAGRASSSGGPGSLTAHNYMDETTEWNVPQQTVLQRNVGSRTPTNLPGARRITTEELRQTTAQYLLIDVLDGRPHNTIPGAIYMPGAGNYGRGSFNDQLQKKLFKVLADLTKNNHNQPIVFFCEGAECWESYNAALRAINMGFRNVLWYRGGLESWRAAELPTAEPAATYAIR
jgi:PQQ-dependent catabolism-associated CXXCW motif protein